MITIITIQIVISIKYYVYCLPKTASFLIDEDFQQHDERWSRHWLHCNCTLTLEASTR